MEVSTCDDFIKDSVFFPAWSVAPQEDEWDSKTVCSGNHSFLSSKPSVETYSDSDEDYGVEESCLEYLYPNSTKEVFADKVWRHTAGRVSMLARIPIYLVASGIQIAKISFKMVFTLFITFGDWATGGKYNKTLDSWTIFGVAKDALMLLKLLDKVGSSILGVIFAPPKQYISLGEALSTSFKIIYGKHQNIRYGMDQRPLKVSEAWKLVKMRPEYHRHIISHDSLNKNFINRIKAG
ncbi:MAG: hypothetical protein H7A41_02760 [Chlamydiales bacterium]|nr:hypothetical protein [Chlamydiales bacterium]